MVQEILSPPVAASVRVADRYTKSWALALLCSDIAMFVLCSYAAIHIVGVWKPKHDIFQGRVYLSAAVFVVIWIAAFQVVGLYERSFALSRRDEFYCTVAALCVGIAPQLVLFTIFPSIASSRLILLFSLLLSIVAVGGTRALAHAIRDADVKRPRRISIVGQADRIGAVINSLHFNDHDEVRRFEVDDVDAALQQINLTEDPGLDNIAWFHAAKQWSSDTVILTEVVHPDLLPHLLQIAERHRIKLAFAPPRLKWQAFSLAFETNGHQALIVPRSLRACRPPAQLVKRIFDIVVGSAMLVLFSPLMLVIAAIIWADRSGPVLYRQERIKRSGGTFNILKFRTMPCTAEQQTGPVWTQAGDKRATKLGALLRRTSLDEIPQLFNVLRGEMSIVGPRPERPVFAEIFRGHLPRYDERHLVSPGLTGWSHVQMKRNSSRSDIGVRLSHDLFYIENWSIFMDISVIFKTGVEFLFHKAV